MRGRFFGGGKTPPYSTTRQRLPLRGAPAARRVKGGPWGRNQHPATLQSPSVTASLKGSLLGPRVHRADMESAPTPTKIWPRRGQCGGRRKSVKKNAALLHFLAFSLTDHLFGVPRGEQPLGRASRAIGSSGHFFGSFWVSKRNTWRKSPIKFKRAAARWRQADAATQQSKAGKIFHFVARFRHHQHPRAHTIVP